MLKRIKLENFLSFKDETIEFNEGLNVLIGLNGSGKTNVIHALNLLAVGTMGMFKTNTRYFADVLGGYSDAVSKFQNQTNRIGITITYTFKFNDPFKTGFPVGYSEEKLEWDYSIVLDNSNLILWENLSLFDTESQKHIYVAKYSRLVNEISYFDLTNGEVRSAFPYETNGEYLIFQQDKNIPIFWLHLFQRNAEIAGYLTPDLSLRSHLKSPQKRISDTLKLSEEGQNIQDVLGTVISSNVTLKREMNSFLRSNFTFLTEIATVSLAERQYAIYDPVHFAAPMPIRYWPAGLVHMLFVYLGMLNPDAGSIAFDEPDLCLSKDLWFAMIQLFRNSGKQVIFTTHNPSLIALAGLESLILFSITERGSKVSYPKNQNDLWDEIDQKNAGELWLQNNLD